MSLRVGSGLPNIQKKDLLKLKIGIPVNGLEQKAISNILTKTDKEIETLGKQRRIIVEQKKYLLNNLITGQIRLPEFVQPKTYVKSN
jgi:type I restriction enzyme S subunit